MKKIKINVQVVPDVRRKLNDDKYPLKLKVTYKGERKYYGTGDAVTLKQWEELHQPNIKGKLKIIKNNIVSIEEKAEGIIKKISPFAFMGFEDEFFEKPIKYESLKSLFESIIASFKKEERIGTSLFYSNALISIEKFRPGLKVSSVNVPFLKNYEDWLTENNISVNTISMYMRTLRAVINRAIVDEKFDTRHYPFGRNKYQIPSGISTKRSLSKEQLKQIFEYDVSSKDYFIRRSLDFWKFSYLSNGINMMDIARLKWKNIYSDIIVFKREKTKRTSRSNPKKITVIRNEIIDSIIKTWSQKMNSPEDYVFYIIDSSDSAEMAVAKEKQFIKVTNKWMNEIAKELGINNSLTTYVARHSFSTMLLRKGASVEFISESLGHSDIKTTQNYLGGFDLETKKETMKALIDF